MAHLSAAVANDWAELLLILGELLVAGLVAVRQNGDQHAYGCGVRAGG